MSSKETAAQQQKIKDLTEKRQKAEILNQEILQLEKEVPAKYRSGPRLTDPSKVEGDIQKELARSQNNQRASLEEVGILNDKNKTLDSLLEAKTRALHQATQDLILSQDRFAKMSGQMKTLEAEKSKLQEEVSQLRNKQGKSSDALREELGQGGTASQEYFFLLDRLENEIKTKDAEIAELWGDRKGYDAQLKRKDTVIDKLTEEMKRQSQSYEDVAVLEGRVRQFSKRIEEIQQENNLLANLCRVKTQALEKLQVQLNERSHSEEYVRQLETAVRNKERVIQSLTEDIEQHESILRKRDEEINRIAENAANSANGLSFREWYEERKGLKHKIETLDKLRTEQKKTIDGLNQRINQLAGRLETLSRSLSDTASISPRHAGMMVTPRRPGGGVFVDEYQNEMIASELYDALARDVHIMKIKLEEKDNMLIEKDDIIECFERKNEILAKTYGQAMKKWGRQKQDMGDEVSNLRGALEQKELDVKNREQQLKKDNIRLKKQLEAKARRSGVSDNSGSFRGSPREIQAGF